MTWEEVTAVSTLALAAVTAWLALSTRRLAREANAETRANWQPVLVPDVEAEPGGVASSGLLLKDRRLTMRIRNVGRGPALNVTVVLWQEGEAERFESVFRGRSASNVVAPEERIYFQWSDFHAPRPPETMGIVAWSQLEGMITYGDV